MGNVKIIHLLLHPHSSSVAKLAKTRLSVNRDNDVLHCYRWTYTILLKGRF